MCASYSTGGIKATDISTDFEEIESKIKTLNRLLSKDEMNEDLTRCLPGDEKIKISGNDLFC